MRRAVIFAAIFTLVFSFSALCDEYIDAMFAPPSQQELDTAFKRIEYKPYCKDFKTADVFRDLPDVTLYRVTYDSDGLKQTGVFGLPKNATGLPPLFVYNHFGFDGYVGTDDLLMEFFAKNGYAVAAATYRGETGSIGRAEGKMDIIGDETHDVLNLLECLTASGKIDKDKIVMMGISHGGGLTIAALTLNRNIKAAATMSAPTSLMNDKIKEMALKWRKAPASVEVVLQMLVPKDGISLLKGVLGVKEKDLARVPAARQEMLRRSPALFAGRIQCPVLMWYGAQDPVAIWTDGKLIEKSLKSRSIETNVTVFENRGHAFSPDENEVIYQQILDFFNRYIGAKK